MNTGLSRRLVSLAAALGLAMCVHAEGWSPFGIGVLPLEDAQFPSVNESVYGLNLSILGGKHNQMYGLSVSVFGYMAHGVAGFDVACLNIADAAPCGVLQVGVHNFILEEGCGMQVGWRNSTAVFSGLQIGALNIPTDKTDKKKFLEGRINNDVSGAQIGVLNASVGVLNGVEIGAANLAKSANGVQIGALNGSSYFCGVQIGAFDIAKQSVGLQLGVFNYAGEMCGVQIGAVNVASRAFRGVQLGAVNILAGGNAPCLPILRVTLD